MANAPRKWGRPRVWENAAAQHREHRQRQAAVSQALGELLHAVLNARLEDPALQRRVNAATDDVAVLEALTTYYRTRHWDQRSREAGRTREDRTPETAAAASKTDLQKPLDDNQRRVQRLLGTIRCKLGRERHRPSPAVQALSRPAGKVAASADVRAVSAAR